jgi:hypothetical protein
VGEDWPQHDVIYKPSLEELQKQHDDNAEKLAMDEKRMAQQQISGDDLR